MKTVHLFALTLAAVTALAVPVRAQVVTPNPAPTIIKTAPYTIVKPGFYQLGADLTYAGNNSITNDAIITINASNVTLDFAGHYISGPSNKPSTKLNGVFANERGNLNIQNGTITFCEAGVLLQGNGSVGSLNINQRVSNMLISYCYYVGVNIYNGRNSQVLNNRISLIGGSSVSAGSYGISCSASGRVSGNQISDLTAGTGASEGIAASQDVFITGNTISGCDYGVFGGTYQQNLTSNCKTPFFSGVNDGLNY